MKKIITSLMFGTLSFFIFYLAGCFGNSTFILQHWDQTSRAFIAGLGTIAFVASFIVCYNELDDFNKKK